MKISDLSDERRAFLKEMRSINKDNKGREVLVGLTVDETSFYLTYLEQSIVGETNQEDGPKFLTLHDKHEKARLAVLGVEHILRTEKPRCH